MTLANGLVANFDSLFPRQRSEKGQLRLIVRRGEPGSTDSEYRREVKLGRKGLMFVLYASAPPPIEPSELILAATELLLYDYCTSGIDPSKLQGDLPRVPFWIIDGVAQILTPAEYREDLKGVVYAMQKRGRVPSIASIQATKGPSGSGLERIYQRAFHYWLMQELTRSPEYHKALLSWLAELWCMRDENPVLWPDPRTVQRWWTETVNRSTAVPKDANWDLADTKALLDKTLPSELNDAAGQKKEFSFPDVTAARRDAVFFLEMRRKEDVLITLAQRGDILFRSVAAAYLAAVHALIERMPDEEFTKRERVAAAERARFDAIKNEVSDYLNWFAVTRMNADAKRDFARFFDTWQRLEKVDVRPEDPLAVPRLRVQPQGNR